MHAKYVLFWSFKYHDIKLAGQEGGAIAEGILCSGAAKNSLYI